MECSTKRHMPMSEFTFLDNNGVLLRISNHTLRNLHKYVHLYKVAPGQSSQKLCIVWTTGTFMSCRIIDRWTHQIKCVMNMNDFYLLISYQLLDVSVCSWLNINWKKNFLKFWHLANSALLRLYKITLWPCFSSIFFSLAITVSSPPGIW